MNQEKIIEFGHLKIYKQKILKPREKTEIKALEGIIVASAHMPFSVLEDRHLKILCQKLIELGEKYGMIDLDQV